MPDFRPQQPGDMPRRSASADNAIKEAARRFNDQEKYGVDRGGNLDNAIKPANVVLISNNTGTSIPPFSVMATNGTQIVTQGSVSPQACGQLPMFNAIAPATPTDKLVITMDPITNDGSSFGRAFSSGIGTANVLVNSLTDQYASPLSGVTAYLSSGSVGPVKLWEQPTVTGLQQLQVELYPMLPSPPCNPVQGATCSLLQSSGQYKIPIGAGGMPTLQLFGVPQPNGAPTLFLVSGQVTIYGNALAGSGGDQSICLALLAAWITGSGVTVPAYASSGANAIAQAELDAGPQAWTINIAPFVLPVSVGNVCLYLNWGWEQTDGEFNVVWGDGPYAIDSEGPGPDPSFGTFITAISLCPGGSVQACGCGGTSGSGGGGGSCPSSSSWNVSVTITGPCLSGIYTLNWTSGTTFSYSQTVGFVTTTITYTCNSGGTSGTVTITRTGGVEGDAVSASFEVNGNVTPSLLMSGSGDSNETLPNSCNGTYFASVT